VFVYLCSNFGLEYEGDIIVIGMDMPRQSATSTMVKHYDKLCKLNQRLSDLGCSKLLYYEDISRGRWPL